MLDGKRLGYALEKIAKEGQFRRYEGTPVEWAYLGDKRYALRQADEMYVLTFIVATSPEDAVQQYLALFKTINIQHLESLA